MTDSAPPAPTAPCAAPSAALAPRLGAHHFAHLRAIAEGLDLIESARRFLGIGHGHEAPGAHRRTAQAVRAVARRRGEGAWRLIGLSIAAAPQGSVPSLEDFIAERDLDGWSEAELQQMHAEAYALAPKAQRRERLRQRQIALLQRLQSLAAEVPEPADAVAGWFEDATARKLVTAGIVTLGALAEKIALGGRWYRPLPGVGAAKAARIAGFLALLLPSGVPRPAFALAPDVGSSSASQPGPATSSSGTRPSRSPAAPSGASCSADKPTGGLPAQPEPPARPQHPSAALDAASAQTWPVPRQAQNAGKSAFEGGRLAAHDTPPAADSLPAPAGALLQPGSDAQAVEAWIAARAGSLATARAYQREATRLRLWLQHEAGAKALGEMGARECAAFMAFLQHIPPAWMSRARAAPGDKGWAPFRGPLSHQSQQQAIGIVASLFAWLHAAQYLGANPWVLMNRKTGDDPARRLLDTKALSEEASAAIEAFVAGQSATPARARMLFLLRFVPAVGLRSAELLGARLGDFERLGPGWVLQVHGKGAKNRLVAVPGQAVQALQAYLTARGLGSLESAAPEAPLLASTLDARAAVGYPALYESVKRWLTKAVRAASLPERERAQLARASTHWLRHTFGTRAVARGVPLDVIQAQMGHASIQTTSAIYARAPLKRRIDALAQAFD